MQVIQTLISDMPMYLIHFAKLFYIIVGFDFMLFRALHT